METANNKAAWIYLPVLEFLTEEAATKPYHETGGILMGYFGKPGNIPVILRATGPGPRAVHRRNYYRPDNDFDESQIAELYKRSARRITYLGDWHTHLGPSGYLSVRDKRTLRRITSCKASRAEAPVMLVLSYDTLWDATVWQGKLHKNYMWRKRFSTTKLTTHLFE